MIIDVGGFGIFRSSLENLKSVYVSNLSIKLGVGDKK